MQDRRLTRRSSVSWPARLWLEECLFTPARAIDVSRGGLRISLPPVVSTTLLHLGQNYRIELSPGFADDFICIAEVRHLTELGIGVWIRKTQPLPRSDPHRAPLR
jgi:PilZ domain